MDVVEISKVEPESVGRKPSEEWVGAASVCERNRERAVGWAALARDHGCRVAAQHDCNGLVAAADSKHGQCLWRLDSDRCRRWCCCCPQPSKPAVQPCQPLYVIDRRVERAANHHGIELSGRVLRQCLTTTNADRCDNCGTPGLHLEPRGVINPAACLARTAW
jgi:hypothetical protein